MLTQTVCIQAPLAAVYHAFAKLEVWPIALPDVCDVNVLHDDDYHQEFTMSVQRPGGVETIRGFRFCRPNVEIELIQTTPPPGFRSMRGVWRFREAEDGGVEVSASREFTLHNQTALAAESVAEKIQTYLQTNLQRFKRYIEESTACC